MGWRGDAGHPIPGVRLYVVLLAGPQPHKIERNQGDTIGSAPLWISRITGPRVRLLGSSASAMTQTMTRPWPEVRRRYADAPAFAWTDGMLALIDYISSSGLSAGLYAWTSMFDLCITQAPVAYPYDGPFLQVSPLPDTSKVEFRYIDTRIKQQQWCRVVEARDAASRFEQFVQQLCWSTVPRHEA